MSTISTAAPSIRSSSSETTADDVEQSAPMNFSTNRSAPQPAWPNSKERHAFVPSARRTGGGQRDLGSLEERAHRLKDGPGADLSYGVQAKQAAVLHWRGVWRAKRSLPARPCSMERRAFDLSARRTGGGQRDQGSLEREPITREPDPARYYPTV